MANEEHLKILRQGVETWNKWREENPDIEPDLRRAQLGSLGYPEQKNAPVADLSKVDLTGADLSHAILGHVKLRGAKLEGANLANAYLCFTDLREANLIRTDLQKADMSKADLSEADLGWANLQNAFLMEANLGESVLMDTNLKGCNLSEASLANAKVYRATFRDADLQNADLSLVKGLMTGQLAGADTTGALLPKPVEEFKALTVVEEASKNARKIFISMLLGCLYALLTIATTTDARLLTNSASSPLPIIGTEIPIVGFYWAAPLLLLGLYFYFHLYLQRLWEVFGKLPAVFPDGRPLDEAAYPWLLTGLVRSHVPLLKKAHRRPLSRLQVALSIILAWWVVPFTLLLFWGRFLPRHDWLGTSLHIALLVVSISSAILLWLLARRTLRGERWNPLPWKDMGLYRGGALVLGVAAFFCLLSFGAIEGIPPISIEARHLVNLGLETIETRQLINPELETYDVRVWVPGLLEAIGYRSVANFTEVDVSTKPENWTTGDYSQVKGAQLRDRDLRYARAPLAFLVKADLRNANLQEADLVGTNLEGANLSGADLGGAELWGANLSGANLRGANLSGARLGSANLAGTYLRGANLWNADLVGTNLEGANLSGADMDTADLSLANLAGANLRGANLTFAQLWNANLGRANLSLANLEVADLVGTNLESANLAGADLRGIRNWSDIKSIRLANVVEVKNAPEGFLEWAKENGAVSLSSEEWEELKKEERTSP